MAHRSRSHNPRRIHISIAPAIWEQVVEEVEAHGGPSAFVAYLFARHIEAFRAAREWTGSAVSRPPVAAQGHKNYDPHSETIERPGSAESPGPCGQPEGGGMPAPAQAAGRVLPMQPLRVHTCPAGELTQVQQIPGITVQVLDVSTGIVAEDGDPDRADGPLERR